MPQETTRVLLSRGFSGLKWLPLWTSLRGVGESAVLRSSYFWLLAVPTLARLLVKVGPEVTLTIRGHPFKLDFELPFSWQMFYLASVFFSVAADCYYFGCPKIVKEFRTGSCE